MPRQVRIEFPGAIYHIMCRGDRREAIYEDDTDREIFLATLGEATTRSGWRLHAYVLMGNHYHLLVETPEANLVRAMTWFQTTYTVRYNARHRTTGHLYGGRYKAVLVEPSEGGSSGDSGYFSTLLDYIHLNPVRAGLVRIDPSSDRPPEIESYQWSSLPEYRQKPSRRPEFLETGRAFGCFGLKDGPAGRRHFVERLAMRALSEKARDCGLSEIDGQGLQSTLRRGWCYGSPTFKERLLEIAEDILSRRSSPRRGSKNYSGEEIGDHAERMAEEIIAAGLEVFGLEENQIETMKRSAVEKQLIATIVRDRTTVKVAWLAGRLKMGSPSSVSRARLVIEDRLEKDRALRRAKKQIVTSLFS